MDICCNSLCRMRRKIVLIVALVSFLNCLFVTLIYTPQGSSSGEATGLCTDNSDNNSVKKHSSAISPLDLQLQPWKDDPECAQFLVEFIRRDGTQRQKPMALASFPGSGSTYVRGMIERLTGYFIGSLYADKDMYTKGLFQVDLNVSKLIKNQFQCRTLWRDDGI